MLPAQYLKMWTWDTFGELFEQRLHDFLKLRGLDNVKYLLKLIQIHHLPVTDSVTSFFQVSLTPAETETITGE